MSCPSSNSPIDISMAKITGNCDLKCAYQYKYHTSSCIVTNKGSYISIAYDKIATSPVKYNLTNYFVSEVRIYIPSLHTFSNNNADGEIIIIHNSNEGGIPLYVCVPLFKSVYSNNSSNILSKIITGLSSNAPNADETTTIKLDSFTLNSFVPKKPFFSYSANSPFGNCDQNIDFIVFSPEDSSCFLSSINFNKLKEMLKPQPFKIQHGPLLFYNTKGATYGNATTNGDEIYIDCKPINISKKTKTIIKDRKTDNKVIFNWDELTNNEYFSIVIQCIIFIIVISIFYVLIKYLSGQSFRTSKTVVTR